MVSQNVLVEVSLWGLKTPNKRLLSEFNIFLHLHLSYPLQDTSRVSLSILGYDSYLLYPYFSPTLENNLCLNLIRQSTRGSYSIADLSRNSNTTIYLKKHLPRAAFLYPATPLCPSEELTKPGTCLTSSRQPFITHRQRPFPTCTCYNSALPTSPPLALCAPCSSQPCQIHLLPQTKQRPLFRSLYPGNLLHFWSAHTLLPVNLMTCVVSNFLINFYKPVYKCFFQKRWYGPFTPMRKVTLDPQLEFTGMVILAFDCLYRNWWEAALLFLNKTVILSLVVQLCPDTIATCNMELECTRPNLPSLTASVQCRQDWNLEMRNALGRANKMRNWHYKVKYSP